MRKRSRTAHPPKFLEGFVASSSVVKFSLGKRGHGCLKRPALWGPPLFHLQDLCVSTGVEVDLLAVDLIPQQDSSFYTPEQWLELISSALVASAISAAYCHDNRAILKDACVAREEPEVRISFRNMTSSLLRESLQRQGKKRKGSRDFSEGHACLLYLADMTAADLENLFRLSSLLSFFSCSTSLFIDSTIRRTADQSTHQVMRAGIEAVADVVEMFYFG